VQVEIEFPGSPETVWKAIATGPGVSSWFVPTVVEERDGKPVSVRANFGPGMESLSTVTSWNPPRRFTAESKDLGPDAPTITTEWSVEARGRGNCSVRVHHAFTSDRDDWDKQLEMWEAGWPNFFRILRAYLTHFPGQRCASFQVGGSSASRSRRPGPRSPARYARVGRPA
jgi:uncharacterized protein YndB with AHSA1/START domain